MRLTPFTPVLAKMFGRSRGCEHRSVESLPSTLEARTCTIPRGGRAKAPLGNAKGIAAVLISTNGSRISTGMHFYRSRSAAHSSGEASFHVATSGVDIMLMRSTPRRRPASFFCGRLHTCMQLRTKALIQSSQKSVRAKVDSRVPANIHLQ